MIQQRWPCMCNVLRASEAPCCSTLASVEASNEMCFYCYSRSHSHSLTDAYSHIQHCVHCDVYFTITPPLRSRNVPARMCHCVGYCYVSLHIQPWKQFGVFFYLLCLGWISFEMFQSAWVTKRGSWRIILRDLRKPGDI